MGQINIGAKNAEQLSKKLACTKTLSRLRKSAQGEYYQIITKSIKKFKSECARQEDIENLDDFYLRIDLTNRALSIKDEKGFLPANYFVFMPVPLYYINRVLREFAFCGFLKDKDICPLNELIEKTSFKAGIFSMSFLTTVEVPINTKILLENRFKLKSTRSDGTINFDFSSDEKFDEFLDKVYGTIEKYNLPNTETCCIILGNDIAKGRNPINLKGLEAEMEKEKG